MNLRKNL